MAQAVQNVIAGLQLVTLYTASTGASGQYGNGYPSGTSGASGGTAAPGPDNRRALGSDVHVLVNMGVASGTLSMTLALYGYCDANSTWYHLYDLNNGNAITVATQGNSSSASTNMYWAERVQGVGGAYQRYYVRIVAVGGTTPSIDAYLGFSVL